MGLTSAKEMAQKWNISEQQVRTYCREGRIPGAVCNDGFWYIPSNALKPGRKGRGQVSEKVLPPLAKKIFQQMKKKGYHGLYDYIQINLGYSSCRMASVRLTRNQVEFIFKKGKVQLGFEPIKVSDLIEILNHFQCVDYLLRRVSEPLSTKLLLELHKRLMQGTVDQRKKRVTPGEFRTPSVKRAGRELLPADEIHKRLKDLIEAYESLKEIERRDILDFHVNFERIFPFEDGNGRIGRMIMFKECLRHEVMPFIIDDKHRREYLDGIIAWDCDRSILSEMVIDVQERFRAQTELQKLMEHGEYFLPEAYKELKEMEDDED